MRQVPSVSPPHCLWGHAHIVRVHQNMLLILSAQVKYTQEFYLKVHNWRVENKFNVIKFWVGPFIALVAVNHPEHIKSLLKS